MFAHSARIVAILTEKAPTQTGATHVLPFDEFVTQGFFGIGTMNIRKVHGSEKWICIAVLAVFALPVACAVVLNYYLVIGQLEVRARSVAEEVVLRQQTASAQTAHARGTLEARLAKDPCSPSQIELMRNLAWGASYLQAVGFVHDNHLVCSSYGNHGAGLPLGAADYLTSTGEYVRRAVELPIGTHQKFIVITDRRSGYSTFELPDLLLDVERTNPDVRLGLVAVSQPVIIVSKGDIDIGHKPVFLRGERELTWVDAGGVKVMTRSPNHDYAGVAIIPRPAVIRAFLALGAYFFPVGILLGIASSMLVCLWLRRRVSMISRLRRAIRLKELSLHYMPIVDLQSDGIIGTEALLRWNPSNGESIGPEKFIPLAERHRLIGRLTEAMLTIFATEAPSLLRMRPDLYVSLNLSAYDFSNPAIIERLKDVRKFLGLRNLMIEVTESAFLNIRQAQLTIGQLHATGIRVAIEVG